MRVFRFITACVAALLIGAVPALASSSSGGSSGGTAIAGSAQPQVSTSSHPIVSGFKAKIRNGLAYAPSNAPLAVQKMIWAGDQIRHKPYIYAGGHATWKAPGYDCSGAVSYVLHGAGLIKVSMDSGQMMTWGGKGTGQWVTIYTNPGHAFIEIAGIRFDTSSAGDPHPPPGTGPRWRPLLTDTSGYVARHPIGY